MKKTDQATHITPRVLKKMPLPQPGAEGDKEERGRLLVIGGSSEMPGAILLAATAGLRAGAGKLQIATTNAIASHVAANVPEARVFALPETKTGELSSAGVARLEKQLEGAQAVCIGPGLMDTPSVGRFVKAVLKLCRDAVVVLDAGAISCLVADKKLLHAHAGRAIITPNAGEMASLYGMDKASIEQDQLRIARRAAKELRAVVALKGRETFIARPDGEVYRNDAGNVGLAASGSGDVLAGIVAGLAARGAEPFAAAVWGVYLHARAGDRLAARMGQLGYLPREIPAEIPSLMSELSASDKR